MRYIVTKEIKSDTQVVWKLYFKDFAFLVIWIIVNLYLQDGVHPYLQIPFCVFAILSGVILVMPSATSPAITSAAPPRRSGDLTWVPEKPSTPWTMA